MIVMLFLLLGMIALAVMGYVPMWSVFLFSVIWLSYLWLYGYAGKAIVYLQWEHFGNRLKSAYSAKFGGVNPEFNKEVDSHIKVMRSLSGGSTKAIHEEKLKRLAKFVEVKYIIPQEEQLSEVAKTEQFVS